MFALVIGAVRTRAAQVLTILVLTALAAAVAVAGPCTVVLGRVAAQIGTEVRLHPYVLLAAAALTLLMALASGMAALRSFQGVDPAVNIR